MIVPGPAPLTVHEPRRSTGPAFGLRAAWSLALELARRDLTLHWRHTRLGVLWGVLPPLLTMGALDLFLGRIAKPSTPGEHPYSLFLYSALLPWQLIARAGVGGASVFLSNAAALGQIRFPRVVLPLSHAMAGLPDLALGSLVLAALAVGTGHPPGLSLLLLPLAVLLAAALAFALTLLLGSIAVVLRDAAPASGFAFQLLFVASPILYAPSALHGDLPRACLRANPVTGVVGLFRSAWLGTPVDGLDTLVAVGATLALTAVAFVVFRRLEHRLTDVA